MKSADVVSCSHTMCAEVLLLGGGHVHLPLIAAIPTMIERGHQVTCVSPSDVHYYSGMGPGMLGGTYRPEDVRFPIRRMVESAGGRFIGGRAVRINADAGTVDLADGDTLPYSVLSVNTGSTIARTVRGEGPAARQGSSPAVFHAKPVEELLFARRELLADLSAGQVRAVVVGGGPAAVEIAGNLCKVVGETPGAQARVTLFCGRDVLPGFPRAGKRCAMKALSRAGVSIRAGARVESIAEGGLIVSGTHEPADIVILATGVVPSRLAADSSLPVGTDGSLAVNEYLHVLGHRNIFGGGDCVWFTPRPLPPAGVFAVREGPVLVHNVLATLDGSRLARFRPGGEYMLLMNLGDDTALFWRRVLGIPLMCRGTCAQALKDRIDRAFMRRFGSEADSPVPQDAEE